MANFCWEGRPLYRKLLPFLEGKISEGIQSVKENEGSARKSRPVKKPSNRKVSSSPKRQRKVVPVDYSKEDKEKLNKILMNNSK